MDATEITLRAIARVRLQVLLQQHQAGGVASLWQLQRAFRPATGAWLRSWAIAGDRQAELGRPATWPGTSRTSTRSRGADVETRSHPTQVRAVDGGGVLFG